MIYNGDVYYYVLNLQGDVIRLIDEQGTTAATYAYNTWGELSNTPNALGRLNPIRYRGYYYDNETGFYYLQSRYYDPAIGRFINADGCLSTGQGFVGYNMFAYCGNNPVNRDDPSGMWWKAVTSFFVDVWNSVNTWAKNTFGAEVTTVTTVDYSMKPISEPMPIVVETGTCITKTITQRGDSSKPVSVYAEGDITDPLGSSSAGIKFNVSNFTLDGSVALDNIGISGSWTSENRTNSLGISANLSEFKIGFEYSTAIQWDKTTHTTNYTNVSVSGWWLLAAYLAVMTGEIAPQPAGAF